MSIYAIGMAQIAISLDAQMCCQSKFYEFKFLRKKNDKIQDNAYNKLLHHYSVV